MPGEIEVIGDGHHRPGRKVLPNPADRRRQDHRRAAGGDAGSEGVDDLAEVDALVGVAAAGKDQHHFPSDRDRPALGVMAGGGVAGEEGQGGEGDGRAVGPEQLGRAGQAGAQDDQDVEMVHSGAPDELPSGPGGPIRWFDHSGMVDGHRRRPRNITQDMASSLLHPLAPLEGDEITAARRIVVESGRAEVAGEDLRFAYVGLCDPPKDLVRAVDRGEPVVVDRRVRLVLLQGPEANVTEAIVSVTRGAVDSWREVFDVRPPLQMEEAIHVLNALHENAEWNAALDRRGVTDRSLVQIDPWPAGTFGLDHEKNRRITRCLAYRRDSADDNGYARPLEGLMAYVDMARGEVLEVVDHGVVPLPPQSSGATTPKTTAPCARTFDR